MFTSNIKMAKKCHRSDQTSAGEKWKKTSGHFSNFHLSGLGEPVLTVLILADRSEAQCDFLLLL